MGRLAGFKYKDVTARLKHFGFVFDRHGAGSHEIWRHSLTGNKVTVPHHSKDMAEGTLRAILREAGIDVEDFLGAD
jgi:predicted RNA binding protein YcfA (HicA-like mRNA interferase family)